VILEILVEYPTRCCGFSYDLRKINIIKNNTNKKKENNVTMQSMDRFCSYKKVKSNKLELWLKTINV
jgi:hypothetical protein